MDAQNGEVLVTGATGLVGYHVVQALLNNRRSVRALVRDPERAGKILPSACKLFQGDIEDEHSLDAAFAGCTVVYHCAGIPEQWVKCPHVFHTINVLGTQNVVRAALRNPILEKFIYISTIDVFLARPFERFDETQLDPVLRGSPYRRAKQEADRIVAKSVQDGLPAVFIHPGGIYGASPRAFWFTQLIRDIVEDKLHLIPPGGMPFVYIEDVAQGCLLAEKIASSGERFILDGTYHSFLELCEVISSELGQKHHFIVGIPFFARIYACVEAWISHATGRRPQLHTAILEFLLSGNTPDSSKAKHELGWSPMSLREGVARTRAAILKHVSL